MANETNNRKETRLFSKLFLSTASPIIVGEILDYAVSRSTGNPELGEVIKTIPYVAAAMYLSYSIWRE